MSRYIDADALREQMYHESFETDTEMQRWDSGCWIRYKLFENILEQQPAVDVFEVVHGEWIDKGNLDYNYCSVCDFPISNNYRIDVLNYCPNCGAMMG